MLEEQSNKPFLISIQVLRSIAALCIVIAHSITEIHQAGASFPSLPFDFGIGVDIFFVVSGFVMVLTGSKRPENPSASVEFLRRRLIRVAPLYWFYTSAMLLAIWLVPTQLNNGNISAPLVACSYIFLPCLNESGQYSPVLALGWTLNYEMFFYLIFALALLGRGGTAWFYRLWALLLMSVALGPVVGGVWNFWGNPIILEFLAGAVLALIFIKLGLVQSRTAFLLAVASATVLYIFVTQDLETRFLALGIPAIIFSAGFILAFPNAWKGQINGPAHFLGDSSYSLYLSHPFTLGIFKIFWTKFDSDFSQPTIFFIISVVSSIIVGRVSYVILERPMTKYLLNTVRLRKCDKLVIRD
jgi:exopolysaccharide production protein ExoZ